MFYNQEIINRIEDTLVHFEDAGYSFNIINRFSCKVYDILKRVNTNDNVTIFSESDYKTACLNLLISEQN